MTANQIQAPCRWPNVFIVRCVRLGLVLDSWIMQVEPPIVTITGFNRGMRKAAAEIRETLAVGRADLDKYTRRDKSGGLGCKL